MKIRAIEPENRDEQCVEALVQVWRRSVEASHHFLNTEEISAIEPEVYEGLRHIAVLLVAFDDGERPLAFAGIQDAALEMLFVDAKARGCGIGTQLIKISISDYGIKFVDVNEANRNALDFYRNNNFVVDYRSETDDAGRPYPILHMKLTGSQL